MVSVRLIANFAAMNESTEQDQAPLEELSGNTFSERDLPLAEGDSARLYLKSKKDQSLMRRHPWVFSGAIKRMQGSPKEGDMVSVHANKGRFLGRGIYSGGSIAVRVLTFEDRPIDETYFSERISNAWALRHSIGLADSSDTDIFRLVHAEGDGLPGLIVDVYGDTAIFQAHSIGMHMRRTALAEAIITGSEGRIKGVYDKSQATLPDEYKEEAEPSFIGGTETDLGDYKEYGISTKVDWKEGQKTGFFIDQRENRKYLGELSKGKKVLNTFCYTGGFSLAALHEGATIVHSLDSSQKALDMVEENVALNGFAADRHATIKADAVQYLKELPEDYDIIVLDPPAFAKHRHARHNAIQGYKRLNGHAIRQIKPGGILLTFSCSQVVTPEIFRSTILAAAINEGREVRIIRQLHQPADHPVNIFHPESEYLKGLVLEVR